MTTPVEFLAPRRLPRDDWIASLDEVLRERDDVLAAWFVTARYPRDDSSSEGVQDELHPELVDPPERGVSVELFREFAEVIPGCRYGIDFRWTWTFATPTVLARVREVGTRLWTSERPR